VQSKLSFLQKKGKGKKVLISIGVAAGGRSGSLRPGEFMGSNDDLKFLKESKQRRRSDLCFLPVLFFFPLFPHCFSRFSFLRRV